MDSLKRKKRIAIAAVCGIILLILFCGCESEVKKRPPGFMRLGEISGFLIPEKYLPDLRLLVRRDEGGLYVMSTDCTHDLTALRLAERDGKKIFVSDYSTSSYDLNGKVLSGPAKADLPYYELRVEAGVYGGPKDTLFVQIGIEKPATWRLKVE